MYDLLPTSLLAAGFLGPIAEAVGPFLAPVLTVILTVAGVLWNHEKRIRDLEENKRRRGRTVYGDENDDPLLTREDRQRILGNNNANGLTDLMYQTDASERAKIVSDYGLDSLPSHLSTSTIARSVIQNQTRGRCVLQDQEVTALNKVARAKGLNKASELTANTRADMKGEMGDRTKRLLDGYNADHKDMCDYAINENDGTPPWDGDVNPPAKGNPLK